MVAMTENGAMPDPDRMEEEGSHWLFFCTWIGPFTMDPAHNEEDFIKKVYLHKNMITLDKLPSEMLFV